MKEKLPTVTINDKTYFIDEKSAKLIDISNPKNVIELTNEEVTTYKSEELLMDDYKELACWAIDIVSDLIEEKYNLTPRVLTIGAEIDNPALINGEEYYSLEDQIAGKIEEMVLKRGMRLVHKEVANKG